MTNTPREDIKKYITDALLSQLGSQVSSKHQAVTLASANAEAMLSQYESSINKPEGFWLGVWKGIVSSFISLFLIGAFVIIYTGINTSFWSVAEQAAKAAQQQPIQPNIK